RGRLLRLWCGRGGRLKPQFALDVGHERMRDCCLAFDAIAKALDMSKAQLFEDMVAERLDMLRRQGTDVEASAG
ncbi:MAG: hypothetical protein WBS14_00715, partial [Rhodomicrobium sp.]